MSTHRPPLILEFLNIKYEIFIDQFVKVTVHDVLGNTVNNLLKTRQTAGGKSLRWDATNNNGRQVPAGVYFYTIETKDFKQTKKMILLK